MDAEPASPVRCRLHHPALVAAAAHHQQLDVTELGMPLAADFDEERVEIDVENARAHVLNLATPLAFAGSRSPARAPERHCSMHVGFLGLGAIGAPMAAHLARRGRLTVWNRTASRAVEFAARHGATAVATPREASVSA